ncbi:MAG: YlxR family protein [Candidatus Dormibacteria bacterium]
MKGSPIRSCAGCRTRRPTSELVRAAVTNDRSRVTVDRARRLPGRGAHICRDQWVGCLALALKRRGLARALGVGNDVIEQSRLDEQLRRLIEEQSPSPPPRS